jgi:hypothetical protein
MAHDKAYWMNEIVKMGGKTNDKFLLCAKDQVKIKEIFSFNFAETSPRGSRITDTPNKLRDAVIKQLQADGWEVPKISIDVFTVPCIEGQLTISSAHAKLMR